MTQMCLARTKNSSASTKYTRKNASLLKTPYKELLKNVKLILAFNTMLSGMNSTTATAHGKTPSLWRSLRTLSYSGSKNVRTNLQLCLNLREGILEMKFPLFSQISQRTSNMAHYVNFSWLGYLDWPSHGREESIAFWEMKWVLARLYNQSRS